MSATATSVMALRQQLASGALSRERFRVWDALAMHGPMTGREVDDRLKTVSAHKRLIELCDLGVAEIVGERTCKVTGRIAVEWAALERLPVGEVRKSKTRSRKELEQEVAELKAKLERLEEHLNRQPFLFGGAGQ